MTGDQPGGATGQRTLNRSAIITLGLLAGLTPFAIDLYLPAIPAIAEDLEASIELSQMSVVVYLGTFALAQLVMGPLSDVLGRRTLVLWGLAGFILGSVACMAAPGMLWLLVARGGQALGGAAVAVTIPALVRDLFQKDEYARIMSLVMLVMGFAPMIAPMIGGVMVAHLNWRWLFVVLALIALTGYLLFFRLIPETLQRGQRHPLAFGRVFGNYRLLLRHRAGLGYLLSGGMSFAGMMTFIVASPWLYIELYGVAKPDYGLLFGLNVAFAMTLGALNARYVRRFGAERLLRIGLLVQVAAALWLGAIAWFPGPPPSLATLVVATALFIGMNGILLGNTNAGFMAFFPELAGTASAFAGAGRFGLGALAGVVVSLLHDQSFRPMVEMMALCGVAAGLSYLLLCLGSREVPHRSPP